MADEQFNGAIDLRNESVRKVLNGGEACGHAAKKAEKFFKDNLDARNHAIELIKYLNLEIAQRRFQVFCKFSNPGRCLVRDLYLQEIKSKSEKRRAVYA